jgi:hypothetical protein
VGDVFWQSQYHEKRSKHLLSKRLLIATFDEKRNSVAISLWSVERFSKPRHIHSKHKSRKFPISNWIAPPTITCTLLHRTLTTDNMDFPLLLLRVLHSLAASACFACFARLVFWDIEKWVVRGMRGGCVCFLLVTLRLFIHWDVVWELGFCCAVLCPMDEHKPFRSEVIRETEWDAVKT